MSDMFDLDTDDFGVPLRYSAEWHYGGCLPDTDVALWSTAKEAWLDLIERLSDSDLMWAPMYTDDPNGPLECTPFNLSLQMAAELDRPGVVSGPDGYLYTVEDTHVMTCLDPACGRTFPDLYPSGRCPYEYMHVFSRTAGAR